MILVFEYAILHNWLDNDSERSQYNEATLQAWLRRRRRIQTMKKPPPGGIPSLPKTCNEIEQKELQGQSVRKLLANCFRAAANELDPPPDVEDILDHYRGRL